MATRRRPLTEASPKCLLDIEGQSIFIMTGYKAAPIRDFIMEKFPDLRRVSIPNHRCAEMNLA